MSEQQCCRTCKLWDNEPTRSGKSSKMGLCRVSLMNVMRHVDAVLHTHVKAPVAVTLRTIYKLNRTKGSDGENCLVWTSMRAEVPSE